MTIDWDMIRSICEQVRLERIESWNIASQFHCHKMSTYLHRRLRRMGYDTLLVDGDFLVPDKKYGRNTPYAHWWVVLDGMIIDLTADQFNQFTKRDYYPPILITSLMKTRRYGSCIHPDKYWEIRHN